MSRRAYRWLWVKTWLYRLLGSVCLFYLWALCVAGIDRCLAGEPGAGPKTLLFAWGALGVHILADLWPFSRCHHVWPLSYFYRSKE